MNRKDFVVPSSAQSPNTGTITVRVTMFFVGDALPEAQVTVTNSATGEVRHAVTRSDGTATIAGLSLSGSCTLEVSETGFVPVTRQRIVLRAGETAQFDVALGLPDLNATVKVYGTTQGVRADPELGVRLDSGQIEQTPLLGRKISSVPLLNAAFRNAKGTGDIFMNSVYVVTGAGGRREADFIVDGASGDDRSAHAVDAVHASGLAAVHVRRIAFRARLQPCRLVAGGW